jgi:hypothetical protein
MVLGLEVAMFNEFGELSKLMLWGAQSSIRTQWQICSQHTGFIQPI